MSILDVIFNIKIMNMSLKYILMYRVFPVPIFRIRCCETALKTPTQFNHKIIFGVVLPVSVTISHVNSVCLTLSRFLL